MKTNIVLLQQHLAQLTRELQCASLWDREAPSAEKLASIEPFCVDTLRFEQWLQWVFIPKLSKQVAMPHFSGLANPSDIHTMAEHAFKDYGQATNVICDVIHQIDKTLNQFLSPHATDH